MTSPDFPSDREGAEDPSRGTDLGEIGRYAGHGLTIALSTALFAWLGDWLDGRLGTSPLFVLLGMCVGFGAGFYSMYRQLVPSRPGTPDEPEDEGDPRSGGP